MKTTINPPPEPAAEPIRYPFIGNYTAGYTGQVMIVLFIRAGQGVIISQARTGRHVGELAEALTMDKYVPFKGSITLENDGKGVIL